MRPNRSRENGTRGGTGSKAGKDRLRGGGLSVWESGSRGEVGGSERVIIGREMAGEWERGDKLDREEEGQLEREGRENEKVGDGGSETEER